MTNNQLDYQSESKIIHSAHWWPSCQKEDRRKGHYFWNSNETFCYGPFATKQQAEHALMAYEAGASIPDFDEEP